MADQPADLAGAALSYVITDFASGLGKSGYVPKPVQLTALQIDELLEAELKKLGVGHIVENPEKWGEDKLGLVQSLAQHLEKVEGLQAEMIQACSIIDGLTATFRQLKAIVKITQDSSMLEALNRAEPTLTAAKAFSTCGGSALLPWRKKGWLKKGTKTTLSMTQPKKKYNGETKNYEYVDENVEEIFLVKKPHSGIW